MHRQLLHAVVLGMVALLVGESLLLGQQILPGQPRFESGPSVDLATQGPATQGPATQGPATQGPATQGPATQGPATQGPATQGPATQGPGVRPDSTEPPDARRWLGRARRRRPNPNQRDHRDVKSAFSDVVRQSRKSTVELLADGRQTALGTIVDSQGYILSKASQLTGQLKCRLADGRTLDAQIISTDAVTDLAMLKVSARDLTVIQWSDKDDPAVGSLVATPGLSYDPIAIGVVSVEAREIPAPSGILGVGLGEDEQGPRIDQVMPDSGAEKAGLQVNDVVLSVNGRSIKSRVQLIETIRRFKAGDQIRLSIVRGERTINVRATLSDRESWGHGRERGDFQNSLGGLLSNRRAGFPLALQHDTVLNPSECGGPLVDLDGKAIGINIARSGRVSSFALPVSAIKPLISRLKSAQPPSDS